MAQDETKNQESKKPRLIKRGNEDIDLDRYIRNLEYNFDSWLDSRDLKKKDKDAVRTAYREMLDGYNNGTLTAGLGNRTVDSTGKIKNFGGKGFDSYGYVQNFFNQVLQNQSAYTAPETPRSRYESAKGLAAELNKELFGGREDFNKDFLFQDAYNAETKARGTRERARQVSDALDRILTRANNKELWADNSDSERARLVSNINILKEKLSDGDITENERVYLSNLGLNADEYFFTGEKYTDSSDEEAPKTKEEDPLDTELKRTEELNKTKLTDLYKKWNDYHSYTDPHEEITFHNYRREGKSPFASYGKVNADVKADMNGYLDNLYSEMETFLRSGKWYNKDSNWWNQAYNGGDFEGIKSNFSLRNKKTGEKTSFYNTGDSRMKVFSRFLNNFISRHQEKDPGGVLADGRHVVYMNNGYATVIDPNTGRVSRIAAHTIPGLLEGSPEFTMLQQQQVASNKEGGILKAQYGSNVPYYDLQYEQEKRRLAREKQQATQLAVDVEASGKSQEEYLRDNSKLFGEGSVEWSTADKARAASMIGDITSMVSAFVPGYGTAISAATGVGATLANFTADVSEGHMGDALKGLGMGLGLDAVGLIPGLGTAGKTGKLIKTAVKLAPKLMAASTFLDPKVQASVSKLLKDKDNITVEDWRNIAIATKAATGLTSNAIIGAKRAAMRTGSTTKSGETSVSLKTKNGEIKVGTGEGELKPTDFAKIKNAGNLKEAQEILNGIKGFENKQLKGTFRGMLPFINRGVKKSSFFETSGNTVYNLSDVSGGRFGSLNNKWSDVSIYNRHLYGGINTPNISWWNPFTWGMKQPVITSSPTATASVSVPIAPPIIRTPIVPAHGPNPRSIAAYRTPAQVQAMGKPRDYAIGTGPNARERALGIEFDKKGGVLGSSIPFGQVRKALSGINTNWILVNLGQGISDAYEFDNKGHGYSTSVANDKLPREETQYHQGTTTRNTTLNDAYTQQQQYYTSGNIWNDVLAAREQYLKANPNASDEDFRNYYNEKVKQLRNYKKKNYSQTYGTKGWDDFNKTFQEIYGKYGKYDPAQFDVYGNNTFLRWVNTFKNDDEAKTYRSGKVGETDMFMDNLGLLQVRETADKAQFPNIDATKLIGKPGESVKEGLKTLSSQVEGSGDPREKADRPNRWEYALQRLYPNLLGVGRLAGTLRTNKNIYNILDKSLKPALLNTYELYSPITGAFGEMSYGFQQAADLRRRAATPMTSDASLNLFGMLEANKQARDVENKVYLADNNEIKRTATEALKRIEDNRARWNEIANKNRFAINQSIKDRAQLKADYTLKNWDATSGFLQERQAEANQNLSDYRQFVQQDQAARALFNSQIKIQDAKDKLNKVIQDNKNNPNFDFTTTPEYRNYINISRQSQIDQNNSQNQTLSDLMGWHYSPYKSSFRLTNVK